MGAMFLVNVTTPFAGVSSAKATVDANARATINVAAKKPTCRDLKVSLMPISPGYKIADLKC
jgi:hypothetical protein